MRIFNALKVGLAMGASIAVAHYTDPKLLLVVFAVIVAIFALIVVLGSLMERRLS